MNHVCTICGAPTAQHVLQEVNWLAPEVIERIATDNPTWRREDGACPACVQQSLLQILLEGGGESIHQSIQNVWPLDAEAAFGALPTPLRMHADPRFTGKGVKIAFIDSGFYPHPDLVQPLNRIRTWVHAGDDPIQVRHFAPTDTVTWNGWDDGYPSHWHGLMTSTVAAGNGWISHGLYRGLASDAELVLIQVTDSRGWITNEGITRALKWLAQNAAELGVRVVNISLGGDPVERLAGNPVDAAVAELVHQGISVVVAAGNNGERQLFPPATAPEALTIGGLDDKNLFDHSQIEMWHSNYGEGVDSIAKPELVAPSIWVVAPILPGSNVATEAAELFSKRAYRNSRRAERIRGFKLINPHYQHVDGTSFAAPITSSLIACMLEANPLLTPSLIYDILTQTAHLIPGVSAERQGYGAIEAGRAVATALMERHQRLVGYLQSPLVSEEYITFLLHDHGIQQVQVVGSWDGWALPGLLGAQVEAGVWQVRAPRIPSGSYSYKFILDGNRSLHDPANPRKIHDGWGGFNSMLIVE
jgi:serine protease AprX